MRLDPKREVPMPKKHLTALTGVRFFAAMAVIAYHFSLNNSSALPPFLYAIIHQGSIAVNFFFVLSGFILVYNYFGKSVEPTRFWTARFARIYPVYLFAFIISIPSYLEKLPDTSTNTIGGVLVQMATEVTLLQAWWPWNGCGFNCPGWSISAEAFFYFTFPFVLPYLAKKFNKNLAKFLFIIWVGVIILESIFLVIINSISDQGSKRFIQDFVSYNPLLNSPSFMIGVICGILYVRRSYFSSLNARVISLLEISSVVLGVYLIAFSGIPGIYLRNGLVAPLFALIICIFAEGRGITARLLSLPLLVLLGEASYAMYILQFPVSYWVRALIDATGLSHFGAVVYGAVYLFAIIGLSVLSLFLLETPARKFIIQRLHKFSTKQPKLALADRGVHVESES
jgi:peptidoglycan/LPS O-acetylase OafA/YrhL